MRIGLVYILLMSISLTTHAQNWVQVDTSFSKHDNPKSLYVDTVEDRLYLGGDFTDPGGRMRGGLLYYDGYQIHNLDTYRFPHVGNGYCLSMARYQNKMYVGGNFWYFGKKSITSHSIIQLQGDTFISVNSVQKLHTANVFAMVEYKGNLILGYRGDSLAGIRSKGIVRFDGSRFSPMGGGVLNDRPEAAVYSLGVYKNKLYAGGNFNDSTNNGKIDYKTRNFQVWNDNLQVWSAVDGWKGGFNTEVTDLIEYQGNLYILGGFDTSDGAIANDIVRFDGTYFYAVGNGAGIYSIDKAIVHKNELYVCGSFRGVDGTQAYGIAKWNGTRWCSLSNDVFIYRGNNSGVTDMAVYHDTLFAIGNFDKVSGQNTMVLAKWVGDSSMTGSCAAPANQDTVNYNLSVRAEANTKSGVKVFPNPTSGSISIEIKEHIKKKQVQLYDQSGKVLIWGIVNSKISEMDLTGLESGIYFLHIEGMGVQKVVKKEM